MSWDKELVRLFEWIKTLDSRVENSVIDVYVNTIRGGRKKIHDVGKEI